MSTELQIEELLRWRLNEATRGAPPAPRAAQLLSLARPWWETWPTQFHVLATRLGRINTGYGHAMTHGRSTRTGHPVAVVIVHATDEWDATTRVLYLSLRATRLCLRFQLETPLQNASPSFEVTFVATDHPRPLFSAMADLSLNGEYSLFSDIPEELAEEWSALRVTEKMPFRLILRQPLGVS